MRLKRLAAALCACAAMAPLACDASPAVTDGVLARFVGSWTVTGATRGKPVATHAEVRSTLGGAFMELHVKDPAGRNRYEAEIFFASADDGALVVHWLDGTGGETSKTLGAGRAEGDVVTLVFAYPDGVFLDRLSYDRAKDRWRLLIETGAADRPEIFSDWYFDRATP